MRLKLSRVLWRVALRDLHWRPFLEPLADCRGIAAVEFALVLPVLLLVLLGMCDVGPGLLVKARVGNVAGTTADLVGEYSEMQRSDMVTVFTAAADVMLPFSSSSQSIRLTNIYSNGNGEALVYWSCASGALTPYTANSQVTSTPTGSPVAWFVATYSPGKNTSYIQAEAQYAYTSPTKFLLKNSITMNSTAFYQPRISSYVGFPWDGVLSDAPPLPTNTTTSASVTLSNGASCSYAQ